MLAGGGRRERRVLEHSCVPLHLLLLLLLASPCSSFLPNFWSQFLTLPWKSHTHQHITERAIINVTLESLRTTEQQKVGDKDQVRRTQPAVGLEVPCGNTTVCVRVHLSRHSAEAFGGRWERWCSPTQTWTSSAPPSRTRCSTSTRSG